MTIDVRLLQADDADVLAHVAKDVFDFATDPERVREFLADPRHHIAVAIDDGIVVGFASAVHYVHPDKPPQLWINEVGVAPTHRGAGIGQRVLRCLFAQGRALGCVEGWVGTERGNVAARRLYASVGGSDPPQDFVLYEFDLRDAADPVAPA